MQSMRTRNLEKIEDMIEVFDDWWYENLYLIWKIVHTIIDLPKNIRYTIRKIKNFWHRGIHGWAEMDTWGTDEYIMKVVYELLIEFDVQTNASIWDDENSKLIKKITKLIKPYYDYIYPSDNGRIWFLKGIDDKMSKDSLIFNYTPTNEEVVLSMKEESKAYANMQKGLRLYIKHMRKFWW